MLENAMMFRSLVVLLALLPCWPATAQVLVRDRALIVDGQPFPVRGAAGLTRLAELKALGATVVRTYGEAPGLVLDEAQRLGLKVMVGFWLEHPRRGFNYADPAQRDGQLARLRAMVRQYRNHPALLLWGIGNEVEAELADHTAIWPAIGEAARLVKAEDPNHPRMAVLAEAGGDKIARLMAAAPDINVLGVNSYGEALPSLGQRVRAQGWRGPLIVTELGAVGQWQVPRTRWGAAVEPSSTAKAVLLADLLPRAAAETDGQILFFWGQKQEVTPTWHGLFLPGGEWVQALEVAARAWGGHTPGNNRAPRIDDLRWFGENTVEVKASDPDGDRVAIRWTVMAEATVLGVAGDAEPVPPQFAGALQGEGTPAVRVGTLPPGRYRLFVTVTDGRGAGASANLPFERR